jgi:hypothetical protein
MSDLKTKPNEQSVHEFLQAIPDEKRRADCLALAALMEDVTGCQPRMWGPSMVGFDEYHYKYASGREGDWFIVGFSPRKHNLSLHVLPGLDQFADHLEGIGKFKTGVSCLYIKQLADLDAERLRHLLETAYQAMKSKEHT